MIADLPPSSKAFFPTQNNYNTFTEVLVISGKYGGYLFGPFVHDVVVPSLITKKGLVKQEAVIDLWFPTELLKSKFLRQMGHTSKSSCGHWTIYADNSVKSNICTFNIVVSEVFHEAILDVEQLGAIVSIDGILFESFGDKSVDQLIKAINKKKARILHSWFMSFKDVRDRVCCKENKQKLDSKIKQFCAKGWKIVESTYVDSISSSVQVLNLFTRVKTNFLQEQRADAKKQRLIRCESDDNNDEDETPVVDDSKEETLFDTVHKLRKANGMYGEVLNTPNILFKETETVAIDDTLEYKRKKYNDLKTKMVNDTLDEVRSKSTNPKEDKIVSNPELDKMNLALEMLREVITASITKKQ